jgi:5-methylcytosine-specific restriction endonuclease McrA
MEHISLKNNHVKIKKPLRKKVWSAYNNLNLVGNCYVCNRDTDYDSFECGHIVSVFYGGKTEFNNLKPICSSCNKDMGIHNLEEYKNSLIQELS